MRGKRPLPPGGAPREFPGVSVPDLALGRRLAAFADAHPGFRTRFAPAPTGWLHLGHAVNAVWVWSIARAFGGRVLLRVEDHDRLRCRPKYESGVLDDLDWLGLGPDEAPPATYRGPGPHPVRQSERGAAYDAALGALTAAGLAYPCRCSRRDIARLVGEQPHAELRYPGTCRSMPVPAAETLARRVLMAEGVEAFDDVRLGPTMQAPARQCGDVLVRDRHGLWTYQFAVVVDDAAQDIALIIRGEDLLASTGRQRRLAAMLGVGTPAVLHHPLVRRPDGEKLSKSSGDTGLRDLRAAGWTPARVLGVAAHLGGLQDVPRPIDARDLARLWE